MKVRFLNPPIHDLVGQHYRLNQAVGGPLLSAILQDAGLNASYVDCEYHHWTMTQVESYVKAESPDVVGITVTNLNWEGTRRLIPYIRKGAPKVWVILGGPEVTARPDAAQSLGADCVASGECDLSIVNLVEDRPTSYYPNGIVHDLDSLPLPAWAFSNPLPTCYDGNAPRFERPECVTLWNRGCAHKCSFCSNPIFNRTLIRFRSAENIVAELKAFQAMGAKHIFVYSDELIGMSPKQAEWLIGVCEAITKANLGLTFKTQGRVGPHATRVCLEAMARAGFKAVMWGIESLSQKVLDAVHKGITPDEAWQTLERSKAAGIQNWGFFMVGMPEEDDIAFKASVSGIVKMKIAGLLDYKQVNICTPSPGTELWEQAETHGWLKQAPTETKWFHQSAVMEFPYASAETIKRRLAVLQSL